MTTGYTIVCRAHIVDECYAGSPTERQFGEDLPMSGDGTWDGTSIVCDACYVELQPFTPSGHAENHELAAAIQHYNEQVAWARNHEDPGQLITQAKEMLAAVTPGTPMHRSARACIRIAEREIVRRLGPNEEKRDASDDRPK